MELSSDSSGWNGGVEEMMEDVPSLMTIVSGWKGVTGRDILQKMRRFGVYAIFLQFYEY